MALVSGYLALGSAISSNGVLTELTGNGYARSAVALTYDPVAGVITFPATTVGPFTGADSAAVVAAVYDASTNGNLLFQFAIPSWTSANGTSYTLPGGSFNLSIAANSLFVAGQVPPNTLLGTLTDNLGVNLNGTPVSSGPVTLNISAGALTASSVVSTITYAATVAPNAALANTFKITLTGNVTFNVPTNAVPGAKYKFEFVQDGTGSRLLTLGTGYKTAGGAPALSTAANAIDFIDAYFDGTTFWCTVFKAFA
jgi:hypothetical protein